VDDPLKLYNLVTKYSYNSNLSYTTPEPSFTMSLKRNHETAFQCNLTSDQKAAMVAFNKGGNLFVTGSAGVGKSFIMQQMKDKLTKDEIKFKVVAPTGIAAANVGGVTMHSFGFLGRTTPTRAEWSRDILSPGKKGLFFALKKMWKNLGVLFIDEISMVHRDLFILYDFIARTVMNNPAKPFGGLRLIVCGDFFQIPPVDKLRPEMTPFAFECDLWHECKFQYVHLTEVVRQSDPVFVRILENVRYARDSDKTVEKIAKLTSREPLTNPVKLYPHNNSKEAENEQEYKKLPDAPEITYKAVDYPRDKPHMFKDILIPEVLTLKKGCRVMLCMNLEPQLFNGKTGTVVEVGPDRVMVAFDNISESIPITRMVIQGSNKDSTRRQIPLTLAWAITMHKVRFPELVRVDSFYNDFT
jgi:ATP-dependent DNA helicase PIF1